MLLMSEVPLKCGPFVADPEAPFDWAAKKAPRVKRSGFRFGDESCSPLRVIPLVLSTKYGHSA